ncbi:GEVED domain-containing protein [Chryseobacterium sp. JUb7]|uniref:GEVED domain-containing protein n=1 Tax=Chryseobacterium sp. JUb7 TaxID=2940599 RepID=UPI002167FD6D|nr:GEVED domain-containing protein [Chryseobacterium sp. JUb7]MCS3532719.1 hypothetical protein [Chryseobacterium sp. JUb7]
MTKNLFYLFFCLLGITSYQSKDLKVNNLKPVFCDTNAPTNVGMSNITLTSAVVSWNYDVNTPNYVVRFRPQGISAAWSTVAVSNISSVSLTGLTPCNSYEVQVAKICTVQGTWSEIIVFSTYLNYCASASVDSGVAHISNVTMTPSGGLPQMVSNSGTSNYTDYRPDPSRKVQLLVGSTGNSISVTKTWSGTPGAVSVRAWIDFNGDGIFQASEMMLSSNSNSLSTVASMFNVPVSAFQTGQNCGVAMRVIISETYTSPVCGTFTYGEVEDYGVYLLTSGNLAVNEANKNKEGILYPNPASDVLNISGILGNEFEIYNTAGQKVSEGKISENKVSLHHLEKGVYFIQIKDRGNTTRLKFIKQ